MPHVSDVDLVGRLLAALVLCAAIGAERESRGQVAGLRTHVLVGLGAALFTLVSIYGFGDVLPAGSSGNGPRFDPSRIAAQIVSGIGFLGAGAIIRQGFNVRGLTTAASLWMVAAIGMAAGAGFWFGAVAATLIVLAALIGLRPLRPRIAGALGSDLVVLDLEMDDPKRVARVVQELADRGVEIQSVRTTVASDRTASQLELSVPSRIELGELLTLVATREGVRRVTGARSGGAEAEGGMASDPQER